MGTLKNNQRRLPFIGAIKITWTHTAVYVNLITFLLTTAIFWHTTGSVWMYHYFGWSVSYYLFLLILTAGVLIFSGLFVYKYDVPSTLGWYYDQLCTHSTIYKRDIKEIEEDLEDIKQLIKEINEIKPAHKSNYRRWARLNNII